ncbi:MAG: immune inhibitor A, partial [Euryarchaeota archaeon]|nr:immune inhibitor A [Euryarchaeota archaeon]
GGLTLDPPEGLFVDDVVIYSGLQGAQTEHLALNFTTPNNGNVSHAAIGNAVDEWQHLTTHGVKGPSFQLDSFEDSPLLPDGWAIDTVRGAGWEFRAHNSTWPYGPDAPDSGVSYAGIEFSQKYQPNTWTHLISPSLAIPFGSHARISFKQFICAELGWDGGVVFLSEDDGRTWIPYGTNEPDFYDSHQNMNPQSDIYNLWAMDGSNAKPTCDGQRGSGNVNKSWVTKEADVSQYGGKSIRLKFSFFTDPLVESDGWYLDDVGIYVDWFEEYGTWLSDPIYPADLLGMDSIEIDADIPNGTWVKATVLGTFNDGSPDSKWTNMSLPASLLGLEGDSIVNDSNPIRIRLEMGTTEEQLTPKVHALYLGATRILNSRNLNGSFWYLDPSLQVNLTTSNITNSGITPLSLYQQIMVTPTHPLTAFEISGTGAGVYITILDEKQNPIYSGMMSNNTVQPTSPASQYRVELSIQPGGWLQHLKVDGRRASPAVGAMIDVGNNGIGDWQWPGYSAWGGLGWQTQGCFNPDPHLNCNPMWDVSDSGMYAYPPLINGTSSRHSSVDIQSDMTLNYSFRLPTDATPLGAKILFELESLNGDLNLSTNATLKLAGSPLWSLRGNSTSWWGSFTPYTLNLFAQHDFQSLSNQTLRNWTTYSLEIETAGGTPDYPLRISATILSVEYSLTENISGLGPLVNTLTDSLTPTNSTLPIPVSVGTWQGGLDLWGGIEHAPIMESEVVVVNSPWVPDRTSTITTEHTHLYSPNQLERLSLTIQSQAIPAMKFDVTNMSGNPQFAQNVTSNHLQINSNLSTVTPIENGFRVDWVLQTAWHWDDIDNLEIIAETFDLDQHHLNPDIMIAGSGSNAIENDMEIDFWQVRGSDGRELSAVNSPSYPFEIAAGSIVEASGTIRFQDTIFRPSEANYQVAIQIETES